MIEPTDREYYAARAARALALAESVTDPTIAEIHRHMAASYRELVELSPAQRPALRAVGAR